MARAVQRLKWPRPGLRWASCCAVVLALHGAALAWIARDEDAEGQAPRKAGAAVMARLLPARQALAPLVDQAAPVEHMPAAPVLAHDEALVQGEAPSDAGTVDLNGYVPRRQLTVAPQPTAAVLLPFPASFQDRARYTVVLKLFIEADGRVGRVEFVGAPLPEVLERAARTTFEHARFTPGQVRGRLVKSLIQVEVDFDNLGAG